MKKYFFLSGLPRSGNTLLSSILNQNPDIKVSANSFLCDHMYQTTMFFHSEKYCNFPDKKSLSNLITSSFDSYYKEWDAKYIIDRGPWGTFINLNLLKNYLNNEIKIICTVRDIVEIIASFIKICPNKLKNQLNHEIQSGVRFFETYKEEVELFCEVITNPNGQLEESLFSLQNLLKKDNRKYLHLIEYKDLIKNPEKTIDEVYDFLNIKKYNHNFQNINQFCKNKVYYDDSIFGGDLHKIYKTIKFPDYSVKDVLPDYLIERYSNREFWRHFL